jgi:predicted DNA-binding transcriptional regulator AlpA
MDHYISASQICDSLNITHVALWRRVKTGVFPSPVKLAERKIAFRESEVRAVVPDLQVTCAPAAAACAEGGAMTPKEKAAAKRRALAQATRFEHISGAFSGIVFRNETQTRTGLVEVIVLDKRGGDYRTIGTVEVKDDGHVVFRGAYLLDPSEIRRP